MKKSLFIMALMVFGTAKAAEVPKSEIIYIAPWDNHVDIRMGTAAISAGCESDYYYRIDLENDTGGHAKLSTLLAAYSSGKHVGLAIGGCVGKYPKILGVRLTN